MRKIFSFAFFFVFSTFICADIIHLLPARESIWLDLYDPEIENAKKEAENDEMLATWLYFIGGDEYFYTGSLYLENNELVLEYCPPGQEGFFENGASIMAYKINTDKIELILKRWTWEYIDEEYEKKEREIVYYHVILSEKDGNIDYNCTYTTPALDLNEYKINSAVVIDENVYAYSAPSFNSERITGLKNSDKINILPTKLAENGPEEKPYDFWYKIEINNKIAWVYGYFINFSNRIKVK